MAPGRSPTTSKRRHCSPCHWTPRRLPPSSPRSASIRTVEHSSCISRAATANEGEIWLGQRSRASKRLLASVLVGLDADRCRRQSATRNDRHGVVPLEPPANISSGVNECPSGTPCNGDEGRSRVGWIQAVYR